MEELDLNHILERNEIKSEIIDFLDYFQNNKKELITQRGIYLHGSSGIGKTRFIKELLFENNYDIIYYDASNMRNKNIIENISKHNIKQLYNNPTAFFLYNYACYTCNPKHTFLLY